jgi:hypothetical protein
MLSANRIASVSELSLGYTIEANIKRSIFSPAFGMPISELDYLLRVSQSAISKLGRDELLFHNLVQTLKRLR